MGAIIGYGLVRSARTSKYPLRVIGMDIYEDAAGQHWCDEFVQAVPAAAPEYVQFVRNLVLSRGINLVLPGVEYDAFRMSRDREAFKDLPARFVLNDADTIRIASDKWLTHCRLTEAGLPTIKTRIDGSFDELAEALGLPFLFKPRRLSGARESRRFPPIWNSNACGRNSRTTSWFSRSWAMTRWNTPWACSATATALIRTHWRLQRRLSREGATAKARTVVVPVLEATVSKLVALFDL